MSEPSQTASDMSKTPPLPIEEPVEATASMDDEAGGEGIDSPIDSPGALLAEITLLIDEINMVHGHVERNLPIDLAGFHDRIAAICGAVYGFEHDVAMIMAEPMINLINALDRLGRKIDAAIGAPLPHQRATSAYLRTEESDQ